MTIATVAFVPAAPLLIPQIAGGSAGVDESLRAASLDAVARAVAGRPHEVVVVAAVPSPAAWSGESTWDFAGFGVPRTPPDARPVLPWSLGIGAWCLDECEWRGTRRYVGVGQSQASMPAASAPPQDRTTAVVVVGDGSACRSERAPGHLDDRAESFDRSVAELLASGDATGLGGLDAALAAELICSGLPAWRWTAAVLDGASATSAELLADAAPYGVGYFVALWSYS